MTCGGNQPCMTYKTDNFIWFSLITFPDSNIITVNLGQLLAQSAAFLLMVEAGKHWGHCGREKATPSNISFPATRNVNCITLSKGNDGWTQL